MEHEFELNYKNLSIHHLDREELVFELGVRGLPYTDTETRAALTRRLKEHIKSERDGSKLDLDFNRLEKTIDAEIEQLDFRIKQIKDYLLNREKYDGTRESLKTKLVHYFGRTKLLIDCTDNEQDLADIDALQTVVNELYNAHFSRYSPLNQQEIIRHINESMSNLFETNANVNERQEKDSSLEEELVSIHPMEDESRTVETQANQSANHTVNRSKRTLQSVNVGNRNLNAITNSYPYLVPPFINPWMWGYPPNQGVPVSDGVIKIPVGNPTERVEKSKNNPRAQFDNSGMAGTACRLGRNCGNLEKESEGTDWQLDREEPRVGNQFRTHSKSRPVSDWNLKYDGTDNGINLMRFLREAEFYAKAENISERELFGSPIHLFRGPAKTWFMVGIENDDFGTWRELKDELKREFLSPDHDHQNEIRAIARKQGAREKFQDYFLEMQQIFNSLTKPLTEKKKFELVFRNLRADYKAHAVSSEVDNLADLKRFGKRLDATFWYKYQPTSNESNTRGKHVQINEISTGTRPKQYVDRNVDQDKTGKSSNPRQFDSNSKRSRNIYSQTTNREEGLQILVDNYRIPKSGTCLNCRLSDHETRDCRAPKHKFCVNCGFHNVDTAHCPYCKKNGMQTVSEGKAVNP